MKRLVSLTKTAAQRWADHKALQRDPGSSELVIYGGIVSSEEAEWWGMPDETLVSALIVRERLAEIEGDVDVRLNSPGGDAMEAAAIVSLLRERSRQGDRITVKVDGIAASAASVVMVAGDTVEISELGTVMIHSAWGLAIGNTAEIESYLSRLRAVDQQSAKWYADRSDMEVEQVLEAMQKETWYTAEQAVEVGLADKVMDQADEEDEDADPPMRQAADGLAEMRARRLGYLNNLHIGS